MSAEEANNATLMIRLPSELKAELMKQAALNGRRITTEINMRLRVSLGGKGPTLQSILAREAEAKAAAYRGDPEEDLPASDSAAVPTSNLDQAMLKVFHALPVEKQLALLSLFK